MMKEYVLCAIARWENRYVKEWVDYHLSIGFTHIYIFDNNRDGEERIADVIDVDNIYKDRVTIVPYHDKIYGQWQAYYDSYRQLKFDWIAYIDLDEFITLTPEFKSISDLLDSVPDRFGALYVNWMCFGDCGLLDYEEGGLQKRFKRPLPYHFGIFNMFGKNPQNNHVKMIVRSGVSDFRPMTPHNATGGFEACNTKFEQIDKTSAFHDYTFDKCYIKHYITKSIGEYLVQKINRKGANSANDAYSTTQFFLFNRPTIAKMRLRSRLLKEYSINDVKSPGIKWWIKTIIKWYIIVPLLGRTKLYNEYK